jgi:hypothetical protein
MNKSDQQRDDEQVRRDARFSRQRNNEASKLEADLEGLDRRRREIESKLDRLHQPVGLDAIRDLVKRGERLTVDETARLALGDADLYNRLMDERSPVLTG